MAKKATVKEVNPTADLDLSIPEGWELGSSEIFKFHDIGDTLEGIIDGFGVVNIKGDDGVLKEVPSMFFNTATGRYSTIQNYQIRDCVDVNGLVNGDSMRITYKGEIQNGQKRIASFHIVFKRENPKMDVLRTPAKKK
jgi:hypothetical protein